MCIFCSIRTCYLNLIRRGSCLDNRMSRQRRRNRRKSLSLLLQHLQQPHLLEPEEEETQPTASSRLPGGKSCFALGDDDDAMEEETRKTSRLTLLPIGLPIRPKMPLQGIRQPTRTMTMTVCGELCEKKRQRHPRLEMRGTSWWLVEFHIVALLYCLI